jgi:hypothetical protein
MNYESDDDYFLEGVATKFGEFFAYGDEAWYLAPGAFDAARGQDEVKLLYGHDESQVYESSVWQHEQAFGTALRARLRTVSFSNACIYV